MVKQNVYETHNNMNSTHNPHAHKSTTVIDLGRAARLRQARKAAGYKKAAQFADAFGFPYFTYASHENGNRNIKHAILERYAQALRVSLDWLAYGPPRQPGRTERVRIEGYVIGNAEIQLRELEKPDEIPNDTDAPPGTSADLLKAYRYVGVTMMPGLGKNAIIYTLRSHSEPKAYIGELCVVHTAEGPPLIRIVRAHLGGNRYLLVDFAHETIETEVLDAEPIEWVRNPHNANI
jgi:transcriptional regulator with XRE-family HTH domain